MRKADTPMTGGISWPPSDDADSMAAAAARGMPAPIMAGMVADPMVIALAAPLPLTVPSHIEPITADCGNACGERMATRLVARSSDSMQPKPLSTLSPSTNEPITVSAIWGRLEYTPVVVSTLMAAMTRLQLNPA